MIPSTQSDWVSFIVTFRGLNELHDCFRPGLSIVDVSIILDQPFPHSQGWDLFTKECYSCPMLFYWVIGAKYQARYHKWALDNKRLSQDNELTNFENFQRIMRKVSAQLIDIRKDPLHYLGCGYTDGNIYDQLAKIGADWSDYGMRWKIVRFKGYFPNITNILNSFDTLNVNHFYSQSFAIPPPQTLSTLCAGDILLPRDITAIILNLLRKFGPKTIHKCSQVCGSWRLWLYYV